VSGTAQPTLSEVLALWNTDRRDRALAALRGDAALVTQLEAELARLEGTDGPRRLLEHDEVSRQIHRVIRALKAALETPV
jgi:hypothetical protein